MRHVGSWQGRTKPLGTDLFPNRSTRKERGSNSMTSPASTKQNQDIVLAALHMFMMRAPCSGRF